MMSRQCKFGFRIAGVAGIVASFAMAVFVAQHVIASCTTPECMQISCKRTALLGDKFNCQESNVTYAIMIKHNTALLGTPQSYNPIKHYKTRNRPECDSPYCSPLPSPAVGNCAGAGGTDDFAINQERKYCGSAPSS